MNALRVIKLESFLVLIFGEERNILVIDARDGEVLGDSSDKSTLLDALRAIAAGLATERD